MASTSSSSAEEILENTTVDIGTLLLEEEPYVYAIYEHLHEKVCDFCLKKKTGPYMLRCSACKYVHYCDKNCQKSAWKDHKRECKHLKEDHDIVLVPGYPFYLLVLRTILKLQNGGDKTRVYYTKDKFVTFKDIEANDGKLADEKYKEPHAMLLRMKFIEKKIITPKFSLPKFHRIFVSVTSNIADMNANGERTAIGIFLGASLLKHSCEPNAIHAYQGKTFCVRAIKQITDFNWSKITVTYINTLDSPQNRRNHLEKLHKFKCKCDACIKQKNFGVMTGLACMDFQCKGFVDAKKSSLKCNICSKQLDNFSLIQAEQLLVSSSQIIDKLKQYQSGLRDPFIEMLFGNFSCLNIYERAQTCLYEQEGVLHKYHYLHVLLLKNIFIFALSEERFEDAIEYGNELLDCLSVYVGDIDTEIGITHLRLSKIMKRIDDPKWKEHFDKGRNMYKIMFGEKLAEEKINDLLWGSVF